MLVRVVAGLLQAAAGVAVGAWAYARWHTPPPSFTGEQAEAFVHGAASFLVFLFATVWGWLVLWLLVEGPLRVLAAAMEQPFGTAPVALARFIVARVRRAPALRDDVVRRQGDGFVVESARDYDWHALTTVELDGALHTVAREAGTTERPYRYRLAPIPRDHVVRAVVRYARSPRTRP